VQRIRLRQVPSAVWLLADQYARARVRPSHRRATSILLIPTFLAIVVMLVGCTYSSGDAVVIVIERRRQLQAMTGPGLGPLARMIVAGITAALTPVATWVLVAAGLLLTLSTVYFVAVSGRMSREQSHRADWTILVVASRGHGALRACRALMHTLVRPGQSIVVTAADTHLADIYTRTFGLRPVAEGSLTMTTTR
jgi:hypothetical protein